MKVSLLYEAIGKTTADVTPDIANDIVGHIQSFYDKVRRGRVWYWEQATDEYPVAVEEVSGLAKEFKLEFRCYFFNVFGVMFDAAKLAENPRSAMHAMANVILDHDEIIDALMKQFKSKPFILNGYFSKKHLNLPPEMQGAPDEIIDALTTIMNVSRRELMLPDKVGVICEFNPLAASLIPDPIRSRINWNVDWNTTRDTLISIIDHELGHSKRPPTHPIQTVGKIELEKMRETRRYMEYLRGTVKARPKFVYLTPPEVEEIATIVSSNPNIMPSKKPIPWAQMPHERKPEEWDANVHAIIDYYRRLPDMIRNDMTYEQLITKAIPERSVAYMRSPLWKRKLISRLEREGIVLER